LGREYRENPLLSQWEMGYKIRGFGSGFGVGVGKVYKREVSGYFHPFGSIS